MEKTIWESVVGIYYKIDKKYRLCFLSSIIFGFMTHIYALTNHLYNYDELWHTPAGFGTGIELGRWALSITASIYKLLFKDAFTIPFVNGFITILLYAITACLVVSVYEIKDEGFAVLIGGLMISFPTLVCRMFFMFTTHYYALGVMLVSAGVWVVVKKRHTVFNVGIAIVLLVYGMAIYQANFVTGVCMIVGYLLHIYIKKDYDIKSIIFSCASYLTYLVLCMALFLVGSRLALSISGKQMAKIENIDTMGQMSANLFTEGVTRCYKLFLRIPFKDVYSMNPNGISKMSFGIAIIVLCFVLLYVWVADRPIHMKILVTMILAILPISVNLIQVMAISSGTMYSIMTYEIVFILLIPITCMEAIKCYGEQNVNLGSDRIISVKRFDRYRRSMCYILAITLFVAILNNIWFANGNYLVIDYTNSRDYAYYTVLASQIKSLPGYRDDMPIQRIGVPVNDSTYPDMNVADKVFNLTGKAYTNIYGFSSWNIMTRIVGFEPNERNSDEDEAYFRSLQEVIDMPNYPDAGSIKIIDDTVIIKFQDVEEVQ